MIVTREHAWRIITGQVTEHRLPGHLEPLRRKRLVTVSSPSGARCHVEITHCTRSPHGHHRSLQQHDQAGRPAVSDDVLASLGHDTLGSYVREWLLARDTDWLARRAAGTPDDWATAYTAATAAIDAMPDSVVMERWHDRWADLPVWIVQWQVQHDLPRLLSTTGGVRYRKVAHGNWEIQDGADDELADQGYTTRAEQALPGEPEAIDTDRLNIGWFRAAQIRHEDAKPTTGRRRAA